MRKLIGLVLVVAAVAIGANYLLKGGLPDSDEERTLAMLERDYRALEDRVTEAQRSAALTGMDTTSDVEAAIAELDELDRKLTALEAKLEADVARERARKLHQQVEDFRLELR